MTTRVVLVDDHELIRAGLRRAFEDSGDFVVIGECDSLATARAALEADLPDVLVVDIGLPDGDGLDLVRSVRARHDAIGIVVLTMYADDDHMFAALDAGASAFVPKSEPSDRVLAAARHAVSAPGSFTASELASAMQRKLAPATVKLTARERDVLELLAEGLTTSTIARRLFMSESTAKGHLAKLFEKLDATNRTQAVMHAVRLGLVKSDEGA
ncbi:MAG TPA: response regulator transcription factor [Mycobacteriales bacterium]|nr:response regulator transcription factor [Mycobacteriales bacterium]